MTKIIRQIIRHRSLRSCCRASSFLVIYGLSIVLVNTSVFAGVNGDDTQVGRYLTTSNRPLSAQSNLLKQTIQVHFPESVQTVGDAIQHILQFSGYRLADSKSMPPVAKSTLHLPLPLVDRNFGPMNLEAALETLIGHSFRLVIDRVHRLVSFQLRPSYRHWYRDHK